MSDDALYLIELFENMLDNLKEEMSYDIFMDTFDRFSYGSWAIQEVLIDINEYEYYVSVGIIREILKSKLEDYDRYYKVNINKNIRFKHAYDTIYYMFEITGGYIND